MVLEILVVVHQKLKIGLAVVHYYIIVIMSINIIFIILGGSNKGSSGRQADPTYNDPLGQLPERPRTSANPKPLEDGFDDMELDDDMLPE